MLLGGEDIRVYNFLFFEPGDILVFMPGQEDIEVTCALIGGEIFMHRVKYYRLLKLLTILNI